MWIIRFFSSSIGKKFLMALSGLLLLLFLVAHAVGNAAIFFGSDAFQTYADLLHSLPVVVLVFGLGLFLVLLIHIFIGILLFLQNRSNSPKYAVSQRVCENTFASKTMPYTGFIIFLFLIIHVSTFGFSSSDLQISELVQLKLSGFFYGLFYLLSFGALAVHLSHGFWSMLQTFGLNHPRYNDIIQKLTYIVPGFFLIFFGVITLYFMTGLGAGY